MHSELSTSYPSVRNESAQSTFRFLLLIYNTCIFQHWIFLNIFMSFIYISVMLSPFWNLLKRAGYKKKGEKKRKCHISMMAPLCQISLAHFWFLPLFFKRKQLYHPPAPFEMDLLWKRRIWVSEPDLLHFRVGEEKSIVKSVASLACVFSLTFFFFFFCS